MANVFDQFDEAVPASPPAPAANPFDQFDAEMQGAELGRMQSMPAKQYGSAVDPIMQGVTFGTFDEIVGTIGGIDSMVRGEGFGRGYDRAAFVARDNLDQYRQRQPAAAMAGEVGGAIATLPVAPVVNAVRGPAIVSRFAPAGAKVVNAAQRGGATAVNSALTGGIYGGLYGAGATNGSAVDRAAGAAESGALGAGIGAVAPALLSAGKSVLGLNSPPGMGRSITGANKKAERIVVDALKDDAAVRGVSPQQALDEIDQAARQGVPMTALDVGGDAGYSTRIIGDTAANISPQAQGTLYRMLNQRFETQTSRLIDAVNTAARRSGFGTNAPQTREALEAAARAANKPAYDRAMRDGSTGIWHEGFEQLTVAPEMLDAIAAAANTGRTEAALRGARPPTSPFSKNPDGTVNPIPNVRPTLEFWNQVKINLDTQIGKARASSGGDKAEISRLTRLKSQLVGYLDEAVPTYRAAREGAAGFFGAENALDAGAAFVNRPVDNAAAKKAIAAMSPPERALFAEGYATRLIENIREVPDRYTAITKLYNSPAAKERFKIALGDDAADVMEATLHLESIMDMSRQAVTGNSSTARRQIAAQLMAGAGAAGVGAAGGAIMTGNLTDPRNLIGTALMLGMRRGAGALTSRVDQQMARKIADMLASENPQVVRDALARISHSPRLSSSLREGHAYISRAMTPFLSRGAPSPSAVVDSGTGSQPAQADN